MTVAETIVAVATPPGVGGIGVVRLSGPEALPIGRRLTGRVDLSPRHAHYVTLRDSSGATLDDGVALFFRAPHSYTGEDVVELQGHGSPVLLDAIVETCVAQGARRARPGEFTEQAFLNSRLDLAQAEAVADLIHAQTEEAARLARSSLDGALATELEPVSRAIREMRVIIEAEIDFGETDLESEAAADIAHRSGSLHQTVSQLLERLRPARYFAQGMRLALVGAPNVGKSSLMNRLAESEVAIVTDRPGTTRDVLRSPIAIHGIPVEIIDTAGLHASEDPVERIGMERAREAATGADVILELRDLTRPDARPDLQAPEAIPRIVVWNKSDQVNQSVAAGDGGGLQISALTGRGVEALKLAIVNQLGVGDGGTQRFSVRARHIDGLRAAATHLAAIDALAPPDLIAEELRLAERALDELLGRQDHEALLGEIFAGFCIGK
ncbi:tRNA uridine-5-carboxymethylaminomethyl(34) synthesis GTPase MnmE [Thioalkalivibrio sp. ALJ1]|uniref:tRNA uridine-5-carboxymethylaminomethyl(34) synthesis GTPase MnmE n=1 Tax=Thioalkalivibrio sp. ALJ1 TaxID=1158144 RepID=UPI000570FD97|nr:tRNA uridine-5-carboxymethylaminomethyl(34) synthesis GTPase MnmE [Thioalkalivibrio sp. ALJ1]